MAAGLSIDEIQAMSVDEIEKVSNLKCLMSVFGNGNSGRKVEMLEMKALSQDERAEIGELCRADLVAASQV